MLMTMKIRCNCNECGQNFSKYLRKLSKNMFYEEDIQCPKCSSYAVSMRD